MKQDLSPPSPSSRDFTSSLPNRQLIQQKGNPEMHPGEQRQKELGKEKEANHQTKHHPLPPPKKKSCQCGQNSRKSSNCSMNWLLQTPAWRHGPARPVTSKVVPIRFGPNSVRTPQTAERKLQKPTWKNPSHDYWGGFSGVNLEWRNCYFATIIQGKNCFVSVKKKKSKAKQPFLS